MVRNIRRKISTIKESTTPNPGSLGMAHNRINWASNLIGTMVQHGSTSLRLEIRSRIRVVSQPLE
ncbi:MAG: hypothetical protein JW384_00504 [Nitrosomonadaceae bacterium]|nr:hypothetical protein [Nitrosomonadaceae bacterium]